MKRITKTNPKTLELIEELKKHSTKEKSNFWKRVSKDLQKSTRSEKEVNIRKLDKYTKENETIFVPGKVLGEGNLNHKITITAFQYSEKAREKLKSNIVSIENLMKKNPKGKDIRIIG